MSDQTQQWLDDLSGTLEDLARHDRLRRLRTVHTLPRHRMEVEGRTYLNLASNDYLGLGCDLELHRQFALSLGDADALEHVGFTASASRLLGGEHPALTELEALLAQAYGAGRQALLFGSGYHANIGILPALVRRGDLILSDRLVHASLVDGIRLCRANWKRYRHNDLNHLSDLLAQLAPSAKRVFLVTESLFSMDGDTADLPGLIELKERYGAILYLDEAHAVGVRGPQGLGLAEAGGLIDAVDILVGTFGKALASSGAFAIVAPPLREYLVNTARSLIYTTAPPPVLIRWTIFMLQKVLQADERRVRLHEHARLFQRLLGQPETGSQIVPLVVGPDAAAAELSRRLRELGYWVPPIRPPTVPEGTARLRFSLGAGMERGELERLAGEAVRLKEAL